MFGPAVRSNEVWFSADNLVLNVAQAACVVLPAAGIPVALARLRSGMWALVLPLSIVVVVAAISAVPQAAEAFTWFALVLVPVGGALSLGWAMHGARPWLALIAVPLIVLAWIEPDARAGQLATIVLIVGSAVTAARLLGGAMVPALLKLAVIAMATVDAILVFGDQLQGPNATLVAAEPGAGLPQLQSAAFGVSGLGYGDFLAAAVLGAVLAAEGRMQLAPAIWLLAVSFAWDQLFLFRDVLPATVPVAIVLIGSELWHRRTAPTVPNRGNTTL